MATYLFVFWTDTREKSPRVEKRDVARVSGDVAQCSMVYRYLRSEIAVDPKMSHVTNISMNTVREYSGEVKEIFTEEDLLIMKKELGE